MKLNFIGARREGSKLAIYREIFTKNGPRIVRIVRKIPEVDGPNPDWLLDSSLGDLLLAALKEAIKEAKKKRARLDK